MHVPKHDSSGIEGALTAGKRKQEQKYSYGESDDIRNSSAYEGADYADKYAKTPPS